MDRSDGEAGPSSGPVNFGDPVVNFGHSLQRRTLLRLVARAKPSSKLFWYHYDFRRNPKSVGFYSIAWRGGRANWVQTNSNNKGSHDRWFFLSGPKIGRFSRWNLADPDRVVATELDRPQQQAYKKLCEVEMGRIPRINSRHRDWLFALWGNVSTRQAIVERKRAKQAALLAASGSEQQQQQQQQPPTEESRELLSSPIHAVEVEDLDSPVRSLEKRPRWVQGMVRKYVPQWGVLTEDTVCVPAPVSAKEVAVPLPRPHVAAASCCRRIDRLMNGQPHVAEGSTDSCCRSLMLTVSKQILEEDRERLYQAKLRQIEEAETTTLEAISRSKLGNSSPGNSWLGSLISTILLEISRSQLAMFMCVMKIVPATPDIHFHVALL